jgi:transposase
MILVDGDGTPLGIDIASASAAEVNLIEDLIDNCASDEVPGRLLYDKAADSDPLRERLALRQIDLICPHRKNRTRQPLQDGRKLRRFKRRFKVERTISWLGNYRRLLVRHDYWNHIFAGFAQLACLYTVLKAF